MPLLSSDNDLTLTVSTEKKGTALKDTERDITSFESRVKGVGDSMNQFNSKLVSVGSTLTKSVTLPLAAIGVGALKMAGDFEQSLNIFQSVSSATVDQMSLVRQEARELGNDLTLPGISAADAAEAMTELAKAGLSVTDSLTAAKGVLSLAKAGQLDTARAAEIAANALNAFGLAGADASKVADVLAGGANASSAGVNDLAMALQQSAAGAARLKIPLSDTVTALGLFANNGVKGSDAGTSLKTMLMNLVPQTEKQSEAMRKLGLDFFDAKGNFVGLREAADMLQKKLSGLTQEQKELALQTIFGTDSSRAASILAKEGAAGFDTLAASVNKAGAATELAAAQNKGFNGALDNLKSTAETAMIDLGTTLLPVVTEELKKAADMVGKMTDWFNKLTPAQKKYLIQAAEVVAIVGPATLIVGKFGQAIGGVTSLISSGAKVFKSIAGVTKLLAGVSGFGGMASSAGGLTTALAGGGGLLAALGPVLLTLGGIAAVAGVAYLAYRHFNNLANESAQDLSTKVNPEVKEFHDLARDLGVTLTGTSGAVSGLALAEGQVAIAKEMVNKATEKQKTLQKEQADQALITKQRTDDVAKAQEAVNSALGEYGINSPQYKQATDDLSFAQSLLNDQLSTAIGNSLDLSTNTGQLARAQRELKDAESDLAAYQAYLNGLLDSGVGVVAKWGPTALNQVGSIKILQDAIHGLKIDFDNTMEDIQIGVPNINNILQNASYNIKKIQGQADTLNSKMQAITISGGALQSAASLQGHATGVQNYGGGLTVVGEHGPEVLALPRGSSVYTNTQSKSMGDTGPSKSYTFTGNIILGTAGAVREFFQDLDDDSILAAKGLTVRQGI